MCGEWRGSIQCSIQRLVAVNNSNIVLTTNYVFNALLFGVVHCFSNNKKTPHKRGNSAQQLLRNFYSDHRVGNIRSP